MLIHIPAINCIVQQSFLGVENGLSITYATPHWKHRWYFSDLKALSSSQQYFDTVDLPRFMLGALQRHGFDPGHAQIQQFW